MNACFVSPFEALIPRDEILAIGDDQLAKLQAWDDHVPDPRESSDAPAIMDADEDLTISPIHVPKSNEGRAQWALIMLRDTEHYDMMEDVIQRLARLPVRDPGFGVRA